MNSTQRLLAVLRGQMPDRVPISTYELVGFNVQAWENGQESYRRLMDFIRQSTDCLYMCSVKVPNARKDEQEMGMYWEKQGEQRLVRTMIRCRSRILTTVTSSNDSVNTVWKIEHPVKDLDDLAAYLALPYEPGEPDFSELERAWADLGGSRGLPLVSFDDPICELADAFEFSSFLVHALTDTDTIAAALDCLHERRLEELRRILTGPVKNVVFRICGPEYATPPYLPPELFRRFVTRYSAQYVQMIQAAGAFARIHCHGKIARVVDQIAQMAPDALDPLEPPPDGDISLADLKKTLGRNLCLMGGIELRHLENADAPFIEDLVRRTLDAAKAGGRFVLMPTASPINIPLSLKTEGNYFRFIETALEAGKY